MSIIQMMTIGGGTVAPTSVCYLVVGGGAGNTGVGAGGGRVQYGTLTGGSAPVSGTTYTITVGAGGSSGNGSNSSAFGITSCAGLYNGTSGSGYAAGSSVCLTSQVWCNGYYIFYNELYAWGGGGGDSAPGSNASIDVSYWPPDSYVPVPGTGGNGTNYSVTGSYYGGGAGGRGLNYRYVYVGCNWYLDGTIADFYGSNGAGGGGVPNTGGGGTGGVGGSGVVRIRYSNTFPTASATTGSPTYTCSGGYRTYVFTGSGTIRW